MMSDLILLRIIKMRLFIFDKKMIIFGLKTIAGLYIIK